MKSDINLYNFYQIFQMYVNMYEIYSRLSTLCIFLDIENLQKKFEEDKKKLELMKQTRKFKPF